jgi:hypothetical protein
VAPTEAEKVAQHIICGIVFQVIQNEEQPVFKAGEMAWESWAGSRGRTATMKIAISGLESF